MDNIVFSTMIGLVAAFLTAAIGFTKLINDKEAKTSEFRQEWTNSIREVLAELTSSIKYLFELYGRSVKTAKKCEDLSKSMKSSAPNSASHQTNKEALQHNKNVLENINIEIVETFKNIHKNFSLAQLHFKHDDADFTVIESKIDSLNILIKNLRKVATQNILRYEEELKIAEPEADKLCVEITFKSRIILKNEWERIKKGEDNYQKTKSAFKIGSIIAFTLIAVLFICIFIVRYSNHLADKKMGEKKPINSFNGARCEFFLLKEESIISKNSNCTRNYKNNHNPKEPIKNFNFSEKSTPQNSLEEKSDLPERTE